MIGEEFVVLSELLTVLWFPPAMMKGRKERKKKVGSNSLEYGGSDYHVNTSVWRCKRIFD